MGLRNSANLVSASGKSVTRPNETQRLYFPCSPRRIGEARYPITGVAKIRAAKLFKKIPTVARKSRRETRWFSLAPMGLAGSLNAHLQAQMNWRDIRRRDCGD